MEVLSDNDDQGLNSDQDYDQELNIDQSNDQDSNNDEGNNQSLDTASDQNSDDKRSSSDNESSINQDTKCKGLGSSEEIVKGTKWKEGLKKSSKRVNLQHLIYSVSSTYSSTSEDSGHAHTMEESEGVLLRRRHDNQHTLMHQCDSSRIVRSSLEWSNEKVTAIKILCVTGSWGDDDAVTQLQSSSDEEEIDQDELVAKKQKLKAEFNDEYDDRSEDYYSEMKEKLAAQAELNKSTFDGVADELRWKLEGYPAGCYVRMEIRGVPYEMVERFDPRQPLIVGGLSPGEEQLSYLQVGGANIRCLSQEEIFADFVIFIKSENNCFIF